MLLISMPDIMLLELIPACNYNNTHPITPCPHSYHSITITSSWSIKLLSAGPGRGYNEKACCCPIVWIKKKAS